MPDVGAKRALAIGLAAVLIAAGARAADDPRREILEADAHYIAAVLGVDRPALADVLADDVRVVHATGRIDGKAGIIDVLTHLRFQSYRRADVDIRIAGELALLFATTHKVYQGRAGTVTEDDATIVAYQRRDGRWRIVALQNTPIRPER